MKLVGGEHDYFDYLVHEYGEDTHVLFDRRPHKGLEDKQLERLSRLMNDKFGGCYPLIEKEFDRFRFLVFCTKVYLLIGKESEMANPFNPEGNKIKCWKNHHIILNQTELDKIVAQHRKTVRYRLWDEKPLTLSYFCGVEIPELTEFHRLINRPVFWFSPSNWWQGNFSEFNQSGNGYIIPNLNKVGLPKIVPAEQAYQQLAHFISNSLRDTPDVQPPVTIEESLRIEAHGFDRKVSFRHRKG